MIAGTVVDGIPRIAVELGRSSWSAIIDTGFDGGLELPAALMDSLNPEPAGRVRSALAGGQFIEEDAYFIDFEFDGETIEVEATFAQSDEVLIGTQVLESHRLEIDLPRGAVVLSRTAG